MNAASVFDNARIAAVFEEIADLLEVQDENPFRIRAYRNAARMVGQQGPDFAARAARGEPLAQDVRHRRRPRREDPRDRPHRHLRAVAGTACRGAPRHLVAAAHTGPGAQEGPRPRRATGRAQPDRSCRCIEERPSAPVARLRPEDRGAPARGARHPPRQEAARAAGRRRARGRAAACVHEVQPRGARGDHRGQPAAPARKRRRHRPAGGQRPRHRPSRATSSPIRSSATCWRKGPSAPAQCWRADCRSTCASCRRRASARRCSTSPARRRTTSNCAGARSRAD